MIRIFPAFCLLLGLALGLTPPAGADGQCPVPLTLWNIMVRPGDPYILSIRTCQPRGVSQGQALIRRPERPGFLIRRAHLFTEPGDGTIDVTVSSELNLASVFHSPDASLNSSHGPFLAILMGPDSELTPGEIHTVVLDPENTAIFDEDGRQSPFTTLDATITVLDENAPLLIEVTDFFQNSTIESTPGQPELVVVGTRELVRLQRLDLVLYYDASLFESIYVTDLWRYRPDVIAEVVSVEAGVIRVGMYSRRNSINILPGPLFELECTPRGNAPIGASTTFVFDGSESRAVDKTGNAINLEFRDGSFVVGSEQN